MNLRSAIPTKRARFEMIPLIDCVFIILVFLVYSMLEMTRLKGIEVQLPGAASAMIIDSVDDQLTITITETGDLIVDGQTKTLTGLRSQLQDRDIESLAVIINGDASSPHSAVVRVLDILESVGVRSATILTTDSSLDATVE